MGGLHMQEYAVLVNGKVVYMGSWTMCHIVALQYGVRSFFFADSDITVAIVPVGSLNGELREFLEEED